MTTSIMLQPQALPAVMNYAAQLVESGFLPSTVNTAQKAVAIITLGYELGIGAWTALNGINVIQGKPTISPALMLALINRSGFCEDMTINADDKGATVTMKRFGRTAHTETFTFEDARGMGLTGKDNYKKQPRVMLKWRAVSACARVVFPDVLAGLYTTEEIAPDSTTVSEDGEITYEPPPMLEAGEPSKQAIPATNGNGKASTSTESPFIENGTVEHTTIKVVDIVEKDGVPRLRLTADDDVTVLAWTRKPFIERGWIEETEWKAIGHHKLKNRIPIERVYRHIVDDTGEIKGGYWEVESVSEVVF